MTVNERCDTLSEPRQSTSNKDSGMSGPTGQDPDSNDSVTKYDFGQIPDFVLFSSNICLLFTDTVFHRGQFLKLHNIGLFALHLKMIAKTKPIHEFLKGPEFTFLGPHQSSIMNSHLPKRTESSGKTKLSVIKSD